METFKLNDLIPDHNSPYSSEFAEIYHHAKMLRDMDSNFFAVRGEPGGTVLANSKGSFKTPLHIKLGTRVFVEPGLDINNVITYAEKALITTPRKSPNGSPRRRRMKKK